MGKNRNKNRTGVVYSTNDNYDYQQSNEEEDTLAIGDQELSVHIEKKGRGGKTVVIIKGFVGTSDDLSDLGKLIKKKVGTGGSAKDGEIVIQGDCRPKVLEILAKEGYSTKRVGG